MNYLENEIKKFDKVAERWWDPKGEMGSLHSINPLRTRFILDGLDGPNPSILDVGCGGGILAEALARAGAQVTGIDLSVASLEAARGHAEREGLQIDYQAVPLEEFVPNRAGSFDAVTCMEMLEHVPEPSRIMTGCAQALKPGGQLFCSSINRTPKAFVFAIFGGEYILRLLPRGSHSYRQLIRPEEMIGWAEENGLAFIKLASLMYNPFTGRFKMVEGKADVNYMAHFTKK